ncbi:MAG: ParB/RepB/Spo0J family partition protein [Chloroflexi bacterium]|nr:ParB/RepB/Spo0J family partition protein [Chloroflexota bacterium]
MVTRARQGPAPAEFGPAATASVRGKAARIGIDAIVVDPDSNPRRRLRGVDELAASIHAYGLLQPLVVREIGPRRGRYQLIAGHRRLAALQLLAERYPGEDWHMLQVIVRPESDDDAYLLTLVENLQRQDLSPREESEGLAKLVRDRQWSTRRVAAAIGRSQPFVSRRLRVYEDGVLRGLVLRQRLPVSVAEELLGAQPSERAALARRAIEEQWDFRRTRAEVRGHTAAFHPKLREWVVAIRDLVANASLSSGEKHLLSELAEEIRAAASS